MNEFESPPPGAIPIFVISFNRGEYLSRVIESYKAQDIAVDVIIHDNGSTDEDTLEVLAELSSAGLKVYRGAAISSPEELNDVAQSVARYCSKTGYAGPYVVTDCDVELSGTRTDALRTYLEMLDRFTDAECVGPMLSIADIPRSYPLFHRVMARHISQFWGREPEWAELRAGRVAYLKHRIDTTFAVHRAGSTFRRLKEGMRVYHPFEAKHLDWYVSKRSPTPYHRTSSPAISHWDSETQFARHEAMRGAELNYIVVEGEIGQLRTVIKSTIDNPS
jgi:hypothetical protein